MSNTTLPNDPKCACAQNGSVLTKLGLMAQAVGAHFSETAHDLEICAEARVAALEIVLINMISRVACEGTAIEALSQEADWEFRRVLGGLEKRILERYENYLEEAHRIGVEKFREMTGEFDAAVRGRTAS